MNSSVEIQNMDPVHAWNIFQMDPLRIVVICFYAILFLVGLMANARVACMLIRIFFTKTRKSSARGPRSNRNSDATRRQIQFYIFSLCVCDLFILASLALLMSDMIFGEWITASSLLCRIYLSMEGLNKFGAPFLLLALSGFCYSSVNLASSSRRKHACARIFVRTSTTISLFITCALMVTALSAPLYMYGDIHYLSVHHDEPLQGDSDTVPVRNVTKCGFLPPNTVLTAFVAYGFLLGYLLPAGAFTYFYMNLVRIVRRRNIGAGRMRMARLARVTWTSITLVAFYIFCWTPYWVMTCFQYATWSQKTTDIQLVEYQSQMFVGLSYFVHILPYVNCTGFPILYVLSNTTIREAYARLRRLDPPTEQLEMRSVPSLSRSAEPLTLRMD